MARRKTFQATKRRAAVERALLDRFRRHRSLAAAALARHQQWPGSFAASSRSIPDLGKLTPARRVCPSARAPVCLLEVYSACWPPWLGRKVLTRSRGVAVAHNIAELLHEPCNERMHCPMNLATNECTESSECIHGDYLAMYAPVLSQSRS